MRHGRRVLAEHAFGDGVVADEVLGGLPEGLRAGHEGANVAAVVTHEPVGAVDLGEFERGVPGAQLVEAVEIGFRDEGLKVLALPIHNSRSLESFQRVETTFGKIHGLSEWERRGQIQRSWPATI